MDSLKEGISELIGLYGNKKLRGRLLICHFAFFVSSLTYYVIGNFFCFYICGSKSIMLQHCLSYFTIALNGDNFLANQYVYVAVTGLTEIPSYIVPCVMFRFMGRKRVSLILFLVAGVSLLSVLLIPRGSVYRSCYLRFPDQNEFFQMYR